MGAFVGAVGALESDGAFDMVGRADGMEEGAEDGSVEFGSNKMKEQEEKFNARM